MVFQDGGRFVAEDGRWRVPVVFDSLIHRGDMPVTVGVFVDAGVVPARAAEQQPRFNRSFEYDALGDRYARFLLESRSCCPRWGRASTSRATPT
jgi:enterochelin esterase-like enzyme